MLKYFWLKVVGFSTVHLKCAATLHLPDREKCSMTFEPYNSLLIALRDNNNEMLKHFFFINSFTYKSTKTEMSKIISILKINTCRNLGLWSKPASQTYDYAAWNWAPNKQTIDDVNQNKHRLPRLSTPRKRV